MAFSKQAVKERYSFLGNQPLVEEYYKGSLFLNFGLWEENVSDQVAACENLVDQLVAKLNRNGRIVDVGCGNGATTRHLLNFWDASDVVAINISESQLEVAQRNAPGCEFRNMDATQLDFDDNTFEDIICVEAVFHFDTRQDFLKEALRVLKPGGRIALTGILMSKWAWRFSRRVPSANWVKDVAAYKTLMKSVGFNTVEVRDITDRSLKPFFSHFWNYVDRISKEGKIDNWHKFRLKCVWGIQQRIFKGYLLVSAEK